MADTPDTPPTGNDSPATPRRRAPRKASIAKTGTRRGVVKSPVEKAESVVKATATRVKRTAVKAEGAVVDAAKTVTPRASGRGKAKSTTPKAPRKTSTRKAAGTKAKTSKWGVAAIAGGLAAAGAAAAALLSLKGSSAKSDAALKPGGGAHQPDGKDSSGSFDAKIADENTVPN